MAEVRWLFVCQSAPYQGGLAIAGLDAAMAAGAFGQATTLLFTGPGVQQLTAGAPPNTEVRDIGKTIAGLPLYDVDEIFVDARDWPTEANQAAPVPVRLLDPSGIRQLIATATHVVSF